MKKIAVLVYLLLGSIALFAQQKNPTSNKEIQERVKQAQKELDKLSPEQRKMLEQMGMSTSMPSMPVGATDARIGMAVGGDGVPQKNFALINAIPKITLTSSTIPNYLKDVNLFIEKSIDAHAKSFAEQVYAQLKSQKFDASSTGNAAMGYWVSGNPDISLYITGRACAEDPSDDDNLSNFAAMLSMCGAPHKAIPLLEYLNKKYPDNSTILNNLGQAWFYMGDVDKADAKLEQTVRAFACHPQANYTQCLIQQSKGNTSKAIEKMKNSLKYSYSPDKINMLRKMGYSAKSSNMRIPFRPDPDPLGLRKFERPDAPTSYDEELKFMDDWDEFQKQVNEKTMDLGKALIPYQQSSAQKAQKNFEQYQKGGINAMTATASQTENIYRKTAEKNLEEMSKDGGATYRLKKAKSEIDALIKDFTAKDEAKRKELEKSNSAKAEQETELAKKGENIGYDNCVVQKKYSEWVYATYNKPLEQAYKNYLHQLYLKITEELYWKQFAQDQTTFEATKITAKKEWLAALGNTRYLATDKYGKCETPPKNNSRYKLTDFDEIHCEYKSTLDFVVFKEIYECGYTRVEFDAGRLSGNFNFKFDDKGNNRFIKGNLEATAIDKNITIYKGPVEVGANIKAGMGVEFTSSGITDVYATAEASAHAKSTIVDTFEQHISEANGGNTNEPGMGDAGLSDKGVEIGVKGRMSLISGNSCTNVFVNTPK